MPVLQTCPDRQSLSDYALGRLSDEDSDLIAVHLRDCGPCLTELESAAQASDSLLEHLKRPPPPIRTSRSMSARRLYFAAHRWFQARQGCR